MTPRPGIWTVLCLACTPAFAQAPTNVNDCTLLPDPVALKRCVDGFGAQSQRPALPLPSPSGAPEAPQTPAAAKAIPAGPPPGGKAADWLHDGHTAAKPPLRDPNAIKLDE